MPNRVLSRSGARELTPEETDQVEGAGKCFFTMSRATPKSPEKTDDFFC